jgi:hypothetical protein
MSRTDTAVRVISASPEDIRRANRLRRACRVATAGRITGRFEHFRFRRVLSTGSGVRGRVGRGKSAVDSDVVNAMGGHPVDVRSRVDIRADDVPDGINAADQVVGRECWRRGRDVASGYLGCDGPLAVRNNGSMSRRPAALVVAEPSTRRLVTP